MRQLTSHLKLFSIFIVYGVFALTRNNQALAQKAVDWGAYLNDPGLSLSNDEFIEQMVVDREATGKDAIYVVGISYSPPTTQNFSNCGTQKALGNGDAFIAKYLTNTSGSSPVLKWIRYLGSDGGGSSAFLSNDDWGYCIALDHNPNTGDALLYVGGQILKSNGLSSCSPANATCTAGVYQANPSDGWDGFIALYSSTGQLQRWTYFGGKNCSSSSCPGCPTTDAIDEVLGLAVDASHNVYAVGYTESDYCTFPTAATKSWVNTLQGPGDGFIAKFDQCLQTLQFFTYYNTINPPTGSGGASGQDRTRGIKVDANGNLYISGTSPSNSGISFGSSEYQSTYGGGTNDAFAGKWIPDATSGYVPSWSTYVGGSNDERGRQLDIDNSGNVYFTGWTKSAISNLPGAFQTTLNCPANSGCNVCPTCTATGKYDAFVAKFNSSDGSAAWATYLGGNNNDKTNGIRWYQDGSNSKVAVVGLTNSTSLLCAQPCSNASILSCVNGNGMNSRDDAFLCILSDNSSSVSLDYATYLGGSCDEPVGPTCLLDNTPFTGYGPFVVPRVNDAASLFVSFSTRSNDVGTLIGGTLVGSYTNGLNCSGTTGSTSSEAFIARIFNGTVSGTCPNVAQCTTLRIDEESEAIEKPIEIKPNPFSDFTTISFEIGGDNQVEIDLFDMFGREIKRYTISSESLRNGERIDLSNYAAGIYFLKVNAIDQLNTSILIKE